MDRQRAGWVSTGLPGFTMLEVLMAMALFSVALIALASLSTIVIRGDLAANKLSVATTLAQDKLEELKLTSYDNVTSTALTTVTSTPWASRGVDVTPETPIPGVKKIDVTVSWTDDKGKSHSVSLSTLRSK